MRNLPQPSILPAEPLATTTDRHPRPLPWWPIVVYSGIAVALLAWRIHWTNSSGHLSLPWDLTLGWIPLIFAALLTRVVTRPTSHPRWRRFGIISLSAAWLLFFPNAPYLITELIHLDVHSFGPSHRTAPPWLYFLASSTQQHAAPDWLDLLLLTTVAGTGVILTFASLGLVHQLIERRLGRRRTAIAIVALLLLASFGVSLGRFERFNSWDVFRKPGVIAWRIGRRITAPREQPGVTACTLVLTALLTCGYFATGGRRAR